MTPLQAKREAAIKFAGENPVLDGMGKINMRQTCLKYNLSQNHAIRQRIYNHVAPEHKKYILIDNHRDNRPGQTAIAGLPFGEKTKKLGWETIQQPAIYAIVCRTTGRAFISGSLRPDLQRNVHYYWLKNWFKYGTSNTFFGNKKLIDDIKAYGLNDFYMEILETLPSNTTNIELLDKTDEFLCKYNSEFAYNRYWSASVGRRVCQFYDIDSEVKELTDDYFNYLDECDAFFPEHTRVRAEIIEAKRRNRFLLESGKITSAEYCHVDNKLCEEYRMSQMKKNGMLLIRAEKKLKLKKMIRDKKKYYQNLTEPF